MRKGRISAAVPRLHCKKTGRESRGRNGAFIERKANVGQTRTREQPRGNDGRECTEPTRPRREPFALEAIWKVLYGDWGKKMVEPRYNVVCELCKLQLATVATWGLTCVKLRPSNTTAFSSVCRLLSHRRFTMIIRAENNFHALIHQSVKQWKTVAIYLDKGYFFPTSAWGSCWRMALRAVGAVNMEEAPFSDMTRKKAPGSGVPTGLPCRTDGIATAG